MTATFKDSNTKPGPLVVQSGALANPSHTISLSETKLGSGATENLAIALSGPVFGVLTDPLGGVFSPKLRVFTKSSRAAPPAITVSNATNSITSGTTIRPFAAGGVSIADDDLLHDTRNSGAITLVDSAGNPTDAQGTLNGPGLQKVAGATGTYALNSTSTFSFRDNLRQLVFSPLPVAAGTRLATGFKLLVRDNATKLSTSNDVVTTVRVNGPTSVPTPPLIAGTIGGQTVAPGNAIHPFNAVTISDSNANPQISALLIVSGSGYQMKNGTLQGAGLQFITGGQPGTPFAAPNRYLLTAPSPEALTTALHNLVFTAPPLGGQPSVLNTISLRVGDQGLSADDSNTTIKEVADPGGGTGNFTVADQTTGQRSLVSGDPYPSGGPVKGLDHQLILITPDNLNITASVPNSFIRSGSGTDAIDVSGVNGNNVLDGSTGSNFLVGGTGLDSFFLDARNPASDIYSTIKNFHAGDNATIFGVDPVNFHLAVQDNLGAVGAKGLTYTFTAAGKPNASIVIAGFSTADLANGRLTASYGTNADLPGRPGGGGVYLNIHGN